MQLAQSFLTSHVNNYPSSQFLTQVLQCIEEAGAPEAAAASHKANNAWYKAFDLIYGGVAREYSIPTGKNRYHKFKDKILEVWVALESQAPGENHCRDLALEQYERYKRACAEANKSSTSGGHHHHMQTAPNKASKVAAGTSAGGASKLAGGKRSFSTAMGGGPALYAPSGSAAVLWKNLEEKSVLESLPGDLRSLVHLKQLSKEMAACTANRAARRVIEEHSKKLDGAYLEALTAFLGGGGDDDGEKTPAVKTEEASGGDVEMADGENAANAAAAAPEDGKENGTTTTDAGASLTAYDRCLAVAFLHRYASTLHEKQMLADAYMKYTTRCVNFDNGEQQQQQPPQAQPQPQPQQQPPPPEASPAPAVTNHQPIGGEAASQDVPTKAEQPDEAAPPADATMEANPAFPVEVQI